MLTVADTAYAIAVVRDEERGRPEGERLFEDPYASIFAAAGEHAREVTERCLALPSFRDIVRLRTRFIDDAVREGLAAGLGQVVLLGAGFDCRGLRLPEIAAPGAGVYEVDFAAQLDQKRAILRAAGVALPPWIAHVPCDLGAPGSDGALLASLEERGFHRGAGAIFVTEGVLEYLDDASLDRSLAFMVRAGGPGTRLSFTFHQEVFALDRVRRAGFTSVEAYGCVALWRRYLHAEPAEREWISSLGVALV